MRKPRRQLKQKAWDATNARYASLDHPEWVAMDRLPKFFWEDQLNHKRYIKWLGKELGFAKPEDWCQITTKDFTSRRGHGFLEYYEHSPYVVVKTHFPKFDWKPWFFYKVPGGYWKDLDNCIAYAQWFEKQKNISSIEGWYGITQDDVYELCGSGLMDHFDCSVQRFTKAVYPKFDWKPWLFVQVPKDYWPRKKNRVAYMAWLEERLGFQSPEDWYVVSKLDFINNQGGSLMQYGFKTVQLIRELYPDREWHPWKFKQVYQGYWSKKSHRVKYLKWLGVQLGFENASDWLQVKRQDFTDHYGGTLFADHYLKNPLKAVKELFPKSNFKPWEFYQVPNGFWDDPKNCRRFLVWLGKRLGMKKKTDWYCVKRADFKDNCGRGFIKRFKKPLFGLKTAYPNYKWIPWLFQNAPSGFWDDETNRRWYLNWLGRRLRLRSSEAWLKLTAKRLRENYGNGILAKMSVREIRDAGATLVDE